MRRIKNIMNYLSILIVIFCFAMLNKPASAATTDLQIKLLDYELEADIQNVPLGMEIHPPPALSND